MMLLGRFLPIVFVLALAGSLAAQRRRPVDRRHPAHRHARCSSACSPASSSSSPVSPSSRPWRSVRSRRPCHDRRRPGSSMPSPAGDAPARRPCASSTRAHMCAHPVMFVVEVGAVLTTVLAVARPDGVRLVDRRLAVAHRACSPTSPRPSPRAAARPRPPPCARPAPRPSPAGCATTAPRSRCAAPSCALGDRGRRRGRRDHPRRRRRRRGRRQRRRVGDHRRVRAGHPRVRRRPLRGHRRHRGALRPDRRPDHHASPARPSSTG